MLKKKKKQISLLLIMIHESRCFKGSWFSQQQNDAAAAVHRTETRRDSRAGNVELLHARNTFESFAKAAES